MRESPYELDKFLGLKYYITDCDGIGGEIRVKPEDFFVEEVYNLNLDDNGDYTVFLLKKKNYNTVDAILKIARILGVSEKRFSFAGNKDKRAVTVQYVSAYKISEEMLKRLSLRDIEIKIVGKSNEKISSKNLLGNRFRIRIRKVEKLENLENIIKELEEKWIPNYFGYQRFGITRPNTHIVGKYIIKGEFKKAIMEYLCHVYPYEKKEAKAARMFLLETCDYKMALKVFPEHLEYERLVIKHLSKYPRDYVNALRRIPYRIRTLFTEAYQSYLFNKILSKYLEYGEDLRGKRIRCLGYDADNLNEIEREILEEEGIRIQDFKVKSMPELSVKSVERDAMIRTKIKYEIVNRDVVLEFFLPKSSYATTVLREIMKVNPIKFT